MEVDCVIQVIRKMSCVLSYKKLSTHTWTSSRVECCIFATRVWKCRKLGSRAFTTLLLGCQKLGKRLHFHRNCSFSFGSIRFHLFFKYDRQNGREGRKKWQRFNHSHPRQNLGRKETADWRRVQDIKLAVSFSGKSEASHQGRRQDDVVYVPSNGRKIR